MLQRTPTSCLCAQSEPQGLVMHCNRLVMPAVHLRLPSLQEQGKQGKGVRFKCAHEWVSG